MRWLIHSITRSAFRPLQLRCLTRSLSTISSIHNSERISVPVGSSGSVIIDLHNLAKVSSSEPLLLYLPPFSTAVPTSDLAQLPRFAQSRATAVVQYRWTEPSIEEAAEEEAVAKEGVKEYNGKYIYRRFRPGWPAPIHDVLTAYTWIVDNLSPTADERRDIYVYGSYLGASLATSLAFTEAFPGERMSIRGCIAYNGVYDWTAFLPDHPANNEKNGLPVLHSDPSFEELRRNISKLFVKPSNLFDPFASSCHFFHTGGLRVPHAFDQTAISSIIVDLTDPFELGRLSDEELWNMLPHTQPRKDSLVFPPPGSTLRIPDTLLLYDAAPPLPSSQTTKRQKKNGYETLFEAQAQEIFSLIQKELMQMRSDEEEFARTAEEEEMEGGYDEEIARPHKQVLRQTKPRLWGTKWKTDVDLTRIKNRVQIQGVDQKDINDPATVWLGDRTD